MATVALFMLGAELLSSGVVLPCNNAVLVDLLADKGRHSLRVVLEAGSGVVGCTGAAVSQSVLYGIESVTPFRRSWS